MRLAAAVTGSLAAILAAEVRAGERAVTRSVRAETERLKRELREQVVSAFGARGRGIANAWRSRVFPETGESLNAAGLVWSKVPTIIHAFEHGALIRARGGRFLAIPTGFNAVGGRRGRASGGLRFTPQQMVASRQAFLLPFRSRRGFVWCLPVRRGERIGRRRAPLIAGGLATVATARRRGAAAWQAELLRQGFVPMFLLVPQVQLPRRLDVRGAADRALARLPAAIVREWEAIAP
ncbi:DUF6441 family protein [Elioraea tepidiphila]|uniref:DUF6441 family protein n=1 Tax=Elioraea tepidiphila TaxID=457934 RepID=UPI002FD8C337